MRRWIQGLAAVGMGAALVATAEAQVFGLGAPPADDPAPDDIPEMTVESALLAAPSLDQAEVGLAEAWRLATRLWDSARVRNPRRAEDLELKFRGGSHGKAQDLARRLEQVLESTSGQLWSAARGAVGMSPADRARTVGLATRLDLLVDAFAPLRIVQDKALWFDSAKTYLEEVEPIPASVLLDLATEFGATGSPGRAEGAALDARVAKYLAARIRDRPKGAAAQADDREPDEFDWYRYTQRAEQIAEENEIRTHLEGIGMEHISPRTYTRWRAAEEQESGGVSRSADVSPVQIHVIEASFAWVGRTSYAGDRWRLAPAFDGLTRPAPQTVDRDEAGRILDAVATIPSCDRRAFVAGFDALHYLPRTDGVRDRFVGLAEDCRLPEDGDSLPSSRDAWRRELLGEWESGGGQS